MNLIKKQWQAEDRQLPGINCIVYPDGKVTILKFSYIYNSGTKKRSCDVFALCDTTIDSIENYDAAFWTIVDQWVTLDYQGGKIYGGDGAMGNEGFIACVDGNDNLIWGMFFENTNPIKGVEIKNEILTAINEHESLSIEINLKKLTDIKITILKDYGY